MSVLGDRIFARGPARERVEVPEWGETVWVRALTVAETLELDERREAAREAKGGALSLMSWLVCLTAEDEAGARVFSDSDAPRLASLGGRAVYRLYDAAARLSSVAEADVRRAEGNSGAAPPSAS